jgi:hypothetical protein
MAPRSGCASFEPVGYGTATGGAPRRHSPAGRCRPRSRWSAGPRPTGHRARNRVTPPSGRTGAKDRAEAFARPNPVRSIVSWDLDEGMLARISADVQSRTLARRSHRPSHRAPPSRTTSVVVGRASLSPEVASQEGVPPQPSALVLISGALLLRDGVDGTLDAGRGVKNSGTSVRPISRA